jgi:3-oxoacyl-[acyl-carrier protein] reductase
MDLQLKDRTCLVTGASVGIGHGVAKMLASQGAKVAITARRENLLKGLADEIAETGAERPVVIAVDVNSAEAPDVIKQAVYDAYGRLDVLVNNVGAAAPSPMDAPDEVWDNLFDLNFKPTRRLTSAFLPGMLEQKFGRIVNLTGTQEPPGASASTAAKAAIQAWSKGLANQVGAAGITTNCVCPGRIMSEQVTERLYPTEESRQQFVDANIPAGYFGEPEDIACMIVFLCSPIARYVTGTVIEVDGGMKRFSH